MRYCFFCQLLARMTNLEAALRDWQCNLKTPPDSGSIITRCLICFCHSNAPYVSGFVLTMAFASIAGRSWLLSSHLLPMLWAAAYLCHWRSSLWVLSPESPHLAKIRSCFLHNDRSQQLILKFKQGDALRLFPLFARFSQAPFTALAEPNHLILPIPLHAK